MITTVVTSRAARVPSGRTTAMPPSTRWRRPDSSVRQVLAWAAVSAFGRMRRPQATTVSAARTSLPEWRDATASALARARRAACWAGVSSLSGFSSRWAGSTASGTMPIWRSRSSRLGDADARIRGGIRAPRADVRARPARGRLLEAEGDPTLGQVVGRHFHVDAVAGEHADAVLAHLAGGVGQDLVVVVELHPEHGVGQKLAHGPGKLDQIFFRHGPRLGRLAGWA